MDIEKKLEICYIKDKKDDIYLFHQGTNYRSYKLLGAHKIKIASKEYTRFIVWAPRAKEVYLIGDFNNWDETSLPLKRIQESGLWNICVSGVEEGHLYKYRLISQYDEVRIKSDPFAFHAEERPLTASKISNIEGYKWSDKTWLNKRKKSNIYTMPLSIYELNLLSWKKKEDGTTYSYSELSKILFPYIKKMGFTHIEIMPIMEHPFDGSWGYQTTGYYAPTSRYGTPKEFMSFIDECHKNNIGVILDWVPVHFCKDDHGLARFDGTYCFESSDHIKRENDQWGTLNFDFHKPEVFSFLISNALYWIDYYHIDGIRVDAVAYMLYLDYSGKNIKNEYGGRENLQAIEFIKQLNIAIKKYYPDVIMIAEESTSWPNVTKSAEHEGLGFDFKWNMGWMNDILVYMETDPLFRKGNQNALTFPLVYAYSENYILPLSHDEVVHGKKSLLNKMPGDYNQKFANLRLFYQYMYAQPGKKLLFMGGEFGQFIEWDEWKELDWFLLEYEMHSKMQTFVKELNHFYLNETCLNYHDTSIEGFNWIEHTNHNESIIAFERINEKGDKLICIFNFTPIHRENYKIGVDQLGNYKILLTSDHKRFGGDTPRIKTYKSTKDSIHNKEYSIMVDLPSLGGLYLKMVD